MSVKLPDYLDEYIFKELGGYYQAGLNVDYNLKNDEEANKKYIGTYFPRSLVESYHIMLDLNGHSDISNMFKQKKEFNLLDVGAGTGGSFLGIAHFLKKIGLTDVPVNIYSLEGNSNAIEYQNKFIKKFNEYYGVSFKLIPTNIIFNNASTLPDQLKEHLLSLGNIKYDLIISFKFISEFYNTDYDSSVGLFCNFTEIIQNHLVDEGLIILLDLVSANFNRGTQRPYTSQIMSTELNAFVNDESSLLAYILPLCCGRWALKCDDPNCFIERNFEITHSGKNTDTTRVCYRVMANKEYSKKILDNVEEKDKYIVSYNRRHPRICEGGKTIEVDSFKEISTAFGF